MTITTKPDWEHLLAAYLSGRPGADNDLVLAATPVVSRAVRTFLTGPDAEDAAQEALVQVLRKAHTVREPSAFLGWIHAVARNAARRTRRRLSRVVMPVESAVIERHAGAVSIDTDAIESCVDACGALSLLGELTLRERDLMLLLTSDQQPSYDDISRRLGCSVGSIGPTRQRALIKLRRQYGTLAAVA